MNRDEELAALIREQELDVRNGDRVWSKTLDTPVAYDSDITLANFIGVDFFGEHWDARRERGGVQRFRPGRRKAWWQLIPVEFRWWRKGKQPPIDLGGSPAPDKCQALVNVGVMFTGVYCTNRPKFWVSGKGYCGTHVKRLSS